MNEPKIVKLKAELCMSCDFPTRKHNFHLLCNELRKRGYKVDEEVKDMMDSRGEQEIYVEHEGIWYKIFTSTDLKAKEAILDNTLDLRLSDVINKIEKILK
jgi:hypothetical protein